MKQYLPGFTLIEIGVTSVLLVAIIATVSSFWYFVRQNYQFSMSEYQLVDSANQAIRQIATEVRQAEESMNGAYPLEILGDNQLVFYADVDHDGVVERRRYFLDGTTLKRGIVLPTGNPPTYVLSGETVKTIIEGIDTNHLPLFVYYNGDWPGDTTHNPLILADRPLSTRLISISMPLAVAGPTGNRLYKTESTVQIRNLKNNW